MSGARSLARDSRGAIMVLGLFFCSILAAGLWYLAGLGNAMLYRERAQEAADAVAFTAAAVHARGMNLIVLLNLTMAAVLSIRVALKALLTVEIIAEVVFGLICLNPFGGEWACGALPLVGDAIAFTQDAITATREPIDMALQSMSETQTVIARAIPPAALAASAEVGRKYAPGVRIALGISQPSLTSLPVEEGSPAYLCKEAGAAIGDTLGFLLQKAGLGGIGAAAKWIGDRVGSMVEASPAYFCELPGATAPDHSAEIQSAVQDHCSQLSKQASDNGDKFDLGKCQKEQRQSLEAKYKSRTGGTSSASNWEKMTPKKLRADFGNGCPANETMGVAAGNRSKIDGDPKIVAVGHFSGHSTSPRLAVANVTGEVMGALPEAFTQAEFFYDCRGVWGKGACNADGEDAMWHFKWRPRLVLFDDTHEIFKGPVQLMADAYEAQMQLDMTLAAGHPLRRNYPLLRELETAARDPRDLFVH